MRVPRWHNLYWPIERAVSVTVAHTLSLDFADLRQLEAGLDSLDLTDRVGRCTVTIHALQELEEGRIYVTPRGLTVQRLSGMRAVLADQVVLKLDGPPTPFSTYDAPPASLNDDALRHVRALRADPGVENLAELEKALIGLKLDDNSWLETL